MLPAASRCHSGSRERLGAQERSLEVSSKDRVPGCFRHVQQRMVGINAGVVDKYLRCAEVGSNRCECCGDLAAIANIKAVGPHRPMLRIKRAGDGAGHVLSMSVTATAKPS